MSIEKAISEFLGSQSSTESAAVDALENAIDLAEDETDPHELAVALQEATELRAAHKLLTTILEARR